MLSAFEDEKNAWKGVASCDKHEVPLPFNILGDK